MSIRWCAGRNGQVSSLCQGAAALMLAAFFVATSATPSSSQNMTLPGNFGVGASGAATYRVPIAVPSGTAGMVPSLSLEYDSQSGNGIAGVGWSVAGLP